ncbi:MAG: hypothetical protein ISR69_08495 [Gammaproteobacteria bacterium]|nr:hypothetical protein [Gammaproteobacteria bacterium]
MNEQIEGNPFLQFDTKEGFINYRVNVHDNTRSEPYQPLTKQQMRVADLLS